MKDAWMEDFEAWLGNCHLRTIVGGEKLQARAAIWADSAATAHQRLAAHVRQLGYDLLWMDAPSRAAVRDERSRGGMANLLHAVHEYHPVELDQMARVPDGVSEPGCHLIIEEIEAIEPLGNQFGAWPEQNVPEILIEPLFGQPKPTALEIAHYGSAEAVPPMRTYAILDAAKFQWGLSEFEDCGMLYRCLFRGDAAKELKDVAPYLMELDPENRFTRRLFKHVPEVQGIMTSIHLWHREPGIYIRSRSDFDTLWKHFRKFTKLRDRATGRWMFFRFYAPNVLRTTIATLPKDQFEKFAAPVSTFFAQTQGAKGMMKLARRNDAVNMAPFIEIQA